MSPGESMRIAITQAHVVVGTGETIDDGVVGLDGDRIENVSAEESASGRSYDLTVDLEERALIPA
jgi:imidazolonepropionase-like amidohydrolase